MDSQKFLNRNDIKNILSPSFINAPASDLLQNYTESVNIQNRILILPSTKLMWQQIVL